MMQISKQLVEKEKNTASVVMYFNLYLPEAIRFHKGDDFNVYRN
jgi:hypothetical protein